MDEDLIRDLLARIAALEGGLAGPQEGQDPFPLIVQGRDGRSYLNASKLSESFFALQADDFPLTVAAAQSAQTGFSIPEGASFSGDMEIAGIVALSTVPFTLQLQIAGIDGDALMNTPIHHRLCTGRAGLPFVLAETLMMRAGSYLSAVVTNLDPSTAATVRIVIVGRHFVSLRENERQAVSAFMDSRPSRPYWAGLDRGPLTLTAGETGVQRFITMPSGSHLVVESLLSESTGPFTVELKDATSGTMITFPGAIDSRLITGPGRLPARLLGSPIIQPRRSIMATFNDISGQTNTINFALHGRRLKLLVADNNP